jgi:hypothetical protein
MDRLPHLTPRCQQCGGPLETYQGECYCELCWTYAPTDPPPLDLVKLVDTDPDLERERRAWKEETGEDIIILSDGPADPN